MPPLSTVGNRTNRPNGRSQATPRNAEPSSDATLRESSPPVTENDDRPTKRPRLTARRLVTRRGRGRPKKSAANSIEDDVDKLSGFFKRGVNLFVYVPQVINVGNASAMLKAYENMTPDDPDYDEDEKETAETVVRNCGDELDTLLQAYDGVMELFAGFKEHISNLSEQDEDRFWIRVNEKAEQRRAADTRKLKEGAHRIVLEEGTPSPSVDDDPMKKGNGVNHPQLLRMIVPMSVLFKHGDDPTFEEDVQSGMYRIDHDSMPAFMFDVKSYNPYQSKKSFLRGYLPLHFMRFIFLGPGAAKLGKGKKGRGTRPGNAAIVGQTEVTPQMIAYVCVQVRFYISTMHTWGEVDVDFDMKLFYYKVMSFFRKKDAKWVQETLAFWNDEIFGPPKDMAKGPATIDKDDETLYDNLLASIEDDDDDDDEIEAGLAPPRASSGSSGSNGNGNGNNNGNGNRNGAGNGIGQCPTESQTQPDSQYESNAFLSQA